eukprot:9344830-Pyramimonas_sp.AAC.1
MQASSKHVESSAVTFTQMPYVSCKTSGKIMLIKPFRKPTETVKRDGNIGVDKPALEDFGAFID